MTNESDAGSPSSGKPMNVVEVLREAIQRAEQSKDDPTRFTIYRGREMDFLKDVLGVEPWSPENPDKPGLTPDQVKYFKSIFANRRSCCRSGHGCGKSYVLGLAAITFVYTRLGRVIITASTWKQVEDVVFAEIAKLHRTALVPLPCFPDHPLQTELRITADSYIMGLSTKDPTAFQGRHHADILAIVDEAVGVDIPTLTAIGSLCTGKTNLITMVGNPTSTIGGFADAFRSEHWATMGMSCLDHPNVLLDREIIPGAVTREWVEEQRESYGEDSPIWQARVLGVFPDASKNSLTSLSWVNQAMGVEAYNAAKAKVADEAPWVVWALDVARYGDARTVLLERQGSVVTSINDWSHVSTTITANRVHDEYRSALARRAAPAIVVVDESGIGGGVLDRLIELGVPAMGYHSGRRAAAKTLFGNRRAEDYWRVRMLLERNELRLPEHPILRSDLLEITYRVPLGKIYITSKEEMMQDRLKSPDFSDALVMALSMDGEEVVPLPPQNENERDYTEVPPWSLGDPEPIEGGGLDAVFGDGW